MTVRLHALLLVLAMSLYIVFPARAEPAHLYVAGAGGVPLAVTVTGRQDGPEILLIHGLGHGRSSFRHQLISDLADDYRLVAFDLRGHGQSGKPWTQDAYNNSATWAADVLAVMAATGLSKPIVVGWSFGGLVAADLFRKVGSERIAALVLVSSLAGMVNYAPDYSRGGAEMAEAYRLLAEPSLENQVQAIAIIAPFLGADAVDPDWQDTVRQLGLMLPPYVRPLLSGRPSRNNDLLPRLDLPVLVLHGAEDAAIPQSAVDAFIAAAPQATAYQYEHKGHSPFAEDPAAFNATLRSFIKQVWKRGP